MTRKHKIIGFAAAALAVLGLFYALHGGAQAPPGQRPLTSLTEGNFAELAEGFDQARSAVRVIVLLSPT